MHEPVRPAIAHLGWQLSFTGYVQVDSIPWSQDSFDELDPETRAPYNRERFGIPRSRLRAEATRRMAGGVTSGAFELDGNTLDGTAQARLLAASAGWTYPARGVPLASRSGAVPGLAAVPLVAVTAGLIRTPFGMEVQMRERDKPFLEPPAFARALFPGNFDGGVMAAGGYGAARWSIGLMNGSPVFDGQWQGRDPSSSYDLMGRLGAVIEGPRRFRVEAHVSALTGTGMSPGTPPTKDDLQWVDEDQNGTISLPELHVIPGSPGRPSERFDRNALGADVQVHYCLCVIGTGWAFFEAALATNLDRGIIYADPITSSRELRQLGFAAGVVQNLGRYAHAGVRYDRYDADRDANERQGVTIVRTQQVFSTISVMAGGRWHDARFAVQYDRERNPFGRGDDGAPATRAADRLTLRAQVGF